MPVDKDHPMFESAAHIQIEQRMAARKDMLDNVAHLPYHGTMSESEEKLHVQAVEKEQAADQIALDKMFESDEDKLAAASATATHATGQGRVDTPPTHEPVDDSFRHANEEQAAYNAVDEKII